MWKRTAYYRRHHFDILYVDTHICCFLSLLISRKSSTLWQMFTDKTYSVTQSNRRTTPLILEPPPPMKTLSSNRTRLDLSCSHSSQKNIEFRTTAIFGHSTFFECCFLKQKLLKSDLDCLNMFCTYFEF